MHNDCAITADRTTTPQCAQRTLSRLASCFRTRSLKRLNGHGRSYTLHDGPKIARPNLARVRPAAGVRTSAESNRKRHVTDCLLAKVKPAGRSQPKYALLQSRLPSSMIT